MQCSAIQCNASVKFIEYDVVIARRENSHENAFVNCFLKYRLMKTRTNCGAVQSKRVRIFKPNNNLKNENITAVVCTWSNYIVVVLYILKQSVLINTI